MHIARFDDVVGALSPSVHRREELIYLVQAKDCWASEFIYVNKFYGDRSERYDYDEKNRWEHYLSRCSIHYTLI